MTPRFPVARDDRLISHDRHQPHPAAHMTARKYFLNLNKEELTLQINAAVLVEIMVKKRHMMYE